MKIILKIVAVFLIISILLTFYRYVIKKDYYRFESTKETEEI